MHNRYYFVAFQHNRINYRVPLSDFQRAIRNFAHWPGARQGFGGNVNQVNGFFRFVNYRMRWVIASSRPRGGGGLIHYICQEHHVRWCAAIAQ